MANGTPAERRLNALRNRAPEPADTGLLAGLPEEAAPEDISPLNDVIDQLKGVMEVAPPNKRERLEGVLVELEEIAALPPGDEVEEGGEEEATEELPEVEGPPDELGGLFG